jgi:hypothetical protein
MIHIIKDLWLFVVTQLQQQRQHYNIIYISLDLHSCHI